MTQKNELDKRTRGEWLLDPGNLLVLVYISAMVFLLLVCGISDAGATEDKEQEYVSVDAVQAGELLIKTEGERYIRAPQLHQDVSMKISGITSRVSVKQRFVNSQPHWIEAIYVFPMPEDSSVDHLVMRVGERVLEGKIMEKHEAERTHEQAVVEGRKSTLLVQHRPNIFTSRVANIGPGEEIVIEIEFQQPVKIAGGVFSIRYPLVVGPRYIPGKPLVAQSTTLQTTGTGWAVDTDQVPDASHITPPVDLSGQTSNPVDITIDLAAGLPVDVIDSLYHPITTERQSDTHYLVRLDGSVRGDRDFVLEWRLKEQAVPQAALFAETKDNKQYMQLLVMPPREAAAEPAPRELVFIIDISGSMAGESITQAKEAVALALDRLADRDRFNIVVFNNSANSLFDSPKPGDARHLDQAQRFVAGLKADGGTEMKPALLLALDGSRQHERIRQVVFLTDGSVGNEEELLGLITKRLGDSRLFTVGIGSAPNSYFMSRAATMGRGSHLYIGKQGEVKTKMTELFGRLENPALTNLVLDLGGDIDDAEIYPSPLPDLYFGEPLVLYFRTGWEVPHITLHGMYQGAPWQVVIDTGTYGTRPGISSLWARQKIENRMESLALGADKEEIRGEVLKTALAHHLVSRYTSLVAVDTTVSRPTEEQTVKTPLPTLLPQGWQASAVFGGGPQTATPAQLICFAGLVMLLLASIIYLMGTRSWTANFVRRR